MKCFVNLPITYFYPRPPRGGRRGKGGPAMSMTKISIHALREEGDVVKHGVILPDWIFLSTPSARRATRISKQERLFAN